MISKKAITEFLDRELNNYDWMKKEKKNDITAVVKELKPRPKLGKIKLWLHQKVCFLLLVYLKRFMLFLDMGGGKTLLTLALITYRKQRGEKPCAIVFVPYVITVDTWIEETEKWTDLKCVPLIGTTKENLETIMNEEGDLFVVAYQSATAMMAGLAKGKPTRATNKKTKKNPNAWNFSAAQTRKVFSRFDMLVMDEIHKLGNQGSLYYRLCRAISNHKGTEWVLGLTGTPFGREVEMLWSQLYLIDLGETLGETLGLFRAAFFREKKGYWGGTKYEFEKRKLPKLKEMLKNRSIRYTIDECTEMPQKQYIEKHVKPDLSIITYYDKIVENMNAISFGKKNYEHIKSEYMRLRMLSSGFLTLKYEDADADDLQKTKQQRTEIAFPVNPKLDMLEEILSSMPEDSKAIVFHDFVYTNSIISERLKKMKIKHARVWGKQKNSLAEIRKFKKDPNCRVLVINTQSGSSSQNLQMANYVIYFEQPRSAIDRQQSERRAWRPGQTKKVLFFDIFMNGTLDKDCYDANKEGEDLLNKVLNGAAKPRKLGR